MAAARQGTDSMIGILIVAHGTLSDSLIGAVTHVLGSRPPQFDGMRVAASRRSAGAAAAARARSSSRSTAATAC